MVAGADGRSSVVAVLAGNRYREAVVAGNRNKALLTVGDSACLEHVLAAVERSTSFESCVVVGTSELDDVIESARHTKPVKRVDQGESLVGNMRLAIEGANPSPAERVFISTADIPLLTAQELDRFVALVDRSRADAIVALAHGDWAVQHEGLATHYRRSMMVARGGPYLFGNLFAIRQKVLEFAKLIELGRAERKQSRVANILLAFPTLLSLGVRAGPARPCWLGSD